MRRAILACLLALLPSPGWAQINVTSQGTFTGGAVTGATSFLDNANFELKNTTDPTKILRINLDGFSAATTRTLTLPNASTNLCGAAVDCAFSVFQNLTAGGSASPDTNLRIGGNAATVNGLSWRTSQTPDTGFLATGSTGNSWLIAEAGDVTFDFAHALQTNPTLFVHSANQNTTQWISITHNATDGVINTGTGGVIFPMNSMGWSVVAGANTACTTTCTNAAVLGFDTAVSATPVGPADATADLCLCAGAN